MIKGSKFIKLSQPQADLTAQGYRLFKNQAYYSAYRGPVYIYANDVFDKRFATFMLSISSRHRRLVEYSEFRKNGFVGSCDVDDCDKLSGGSQTGYALQLYNFNHDFIFIENSNPDFFYVSNLIDSKHELIPDVNIKINKILRHEEQLELF